MDPLQRDDAPAAHSYQPADPVWVWRHHDGWRPGIAEASFPLSVQVRFQLARDGLGEAVDRVRPEHVMRRED